MRGSFRTLFLAICVPLFAQQPDDLLDRIRGAHLPEEQRNLLVASFSAKNYTRTEEMLERQAAAAGASPLAAELYSLTGNVAFRNGRMEEAIRALRQAD